VQFGESDCPGGLLMANRKTPDNVKKLRGTDQKCRMTGANLEYDLVEDAPIVPDTLTADGQAYWKRIVPILMEKKVLTVGDFESLEVLCLVYGQIIRQSRAGIDIDASKITQFRLLQTEFGLTPASRAKLKPSDDGKDANKFTGNGKKKA